MLWLKEFLQTLDEGQIIEASQENLHDEDGSYWETRIVTCKGMIPLRRVTQKDRYAKRLLTILAWSLSDEAPCGLFT